MTKGEPTLKPFALPIMSCLLHKERHLLSCCRTSNRYCLNTWVLFLLWSVPYYIDNMHTEEQNSTGKQLPSSSDTYAVHFQVREFIPFPRKYKWTTRATKAPVRDSTPYFPLLEGQTGLKRKKEESSELISQSFFMLDVSLLWKMSRETSNFLGCVPVFSNPLYAVINIKARRPKPTSMSRPSWALLGKDMGSKQ